MTAASSTHDIAIPDLSLGQELFAKWQAHELDQEAAFAASRAPYAKTHASLTATDAAFAAEAEAVTAAEMALDYDDDADVEAEADADTDATLTEENVAAAFARGNTALSSLNDYEALEHDIKPFVEALYHAEAPLLGERYTKFTHDDGTRFIAIEKLLFANGLNTGNNKEQMMLEFLLVLASQYQQEPFAEEQKDEFGRVCYIKRRQLLLRRILFNNPFLQNILSADNSLSSEARWEEWINLFIASNHYMRQPRRILADEPHSGSKSRFITDDDQSRIRHYTREELQEIRNIFSGQNSFSSFAQAIYLLRSWSLNFDDGKQWIYKFLFPFGYETIFSELTTTARGKSEYIQQSANYMSGCGEILFSMLQRACAIYQYPSIADASAGAGAGAGAGAAGAGAATDDTATACAPRSPHQLDETAAHEVAQLLVNTFFPKNNPINDIAKALAGRRSAFEQTQQQALQQNLWSFDERWQQVKALALPESRKPDSAHATRLLNSHMLAVKQYAVFKFLAEDFAHILKINLAVQDKFNTLSSIGMLHIMVYLLRMGRYACALEQMQQRTPAATSLGNLSWLLEDNADTAELIAWRNIDMVVAVKASTRSRLRQMSSQCLRRNQSLMADSLEPYAKAQARALMAMLAPQMLHGKLSTQELIFCSDVLKVFFACRIDINLLNSKQEDSTIEAQDFDDILANLCQRIRDNGSKALDVHQHYARSVGLVPQVILGGNNRGYYTLNDELVRHIVYAVFGTKKHMLFDDFLAALYQRYQLVIGPNQASQYYGLDRKDPNFIEEKEFADNADDFKEQLRRLDLLLSLSDGFDYVCNPYGQR